MRVTVVATGFGLTDSSVGGTSEPDLGLGADWISMPGLGGASAAPKTAPTAQPAQPQPQARPAAAIVPPNLGTAANNRRMNVVEADAGVTDEGVINIPPWMRRR